MIRLTNPAFCRKNSKGISFNTKTLKKVNFFQKVSYSATCPVSVEITVLSETALAATAVPTVATLLPLTALGWLWDPQGMAQELIIGTLQSAGRELLTTTAPYIGHALFHTTWLSALLAGVAARRAIDAETSEILYHLNQFIDDKTVCAYLKNVHPILSHFNKNAAIKINALTDGAIHTPHCEMIVRMCLLNGDSSFHNIVIMVPNPIF